MHAHAHACMSCMVKHASDFIWGKCPICLNQHYPCTKHTRHPPRMAPKSMPTCSHHPSQSENSTNHYHLRSSRTCTSYIISFGVLNLYYRRPRGKVGNKSRNVREISHTLRLFRGTFRLFRKCYHGKYEFYTPNEKAYQMKSDEIGMPLPQNHVKSVEYNMPLELCLHVSLHVVVRRSCTKYMCGSAW